MTNIPPEMMITHCEWDFYTAFMGFLPQLTLLATIYLLAHGLIRRRKTGVTPIPAIPCETDSGA